MKRERGKVGMKDREGAIRNRLANAAEKKSDSKLLNKVFAIFNGGKRGRGSGRRKGRIAVVYMYGVGNAAAEKKNKSNVAKGKEMSNAPLLKKAPLGKKKPLAG